jgi:bifunctional DNA-binding transcriptional regulator/antitoxin component of YhaV-PrlF toxin-antitoxin module
MLKTQGTAIMRDRGQLTIPEKIRQLIHWSSPNSVVTVTANTKDELIIRPFKEQTQVDWETVWLKIGLSRSFSGENGNLSDFILRDREAH